MPRNLELKAPLASRSEGAAIARSLGASYVGRFYQTDTYFRVPSGRLKLREFRGGKGELIRYERPDKKGTRTSIYTVVNVPHRREMKRVLTQIFGVLVVVRKRRELLTLRNARIHLDLVKGLGSFIEFEVIVRQNMPQARRLMKHLRSAFSIRNRDCIATSYSALLINQQR
jgi:predicted adenylyl cyclase CyaB